MRRKKLCKLLSIVLTMSMVVGLTGCGAAKEEAASMITKENEEAALTAALSQQVKSSDTNVKEGKEETVYALADASGAVNKVIVSDWLKNPKAEEKLTDVTDLSEVKNVKGYEDYVEGQDGTLTWNANGSDIYYQGTTNKELPVQVKLSYTLDGKPITPEELVGKSGKVTIRFDYENKATQKEKIGDEETDVIVPFAMISGMVLPTDKFANVEVTNGKLISEGSNDLVVGVALPGLKEDLTTTKTEDKLEDVNIPDYLEVTADATDFELDMTMTMAMSDVLSDIDMTDSIDLSELNDSMDDLNEASGELIDGTGDLKDGTQELKDGTTELKDGTADLVDGVQDLKDGTVKLKDGTQELYTKSGELDDGATKLNDGATDLKSGAQKLSDGAETLQSGVKDLNSGAKQIKEGAAAAKTGANQLVAGYEGNGTAENPGLVNASAQVTEGAAQVHTGVQSLVATVTATTQNLAALHENIVTLKALVEATDSAVQQVSALDGQVKGRSTAAKQLAAGIEQALAAQLAEAQTAENQAKITALLNGTAQLETGTAQMNTGIGQLYAGTRQLAGSDGLAKLSAGAAELADGTQKLSEKAPTLVKGVNDLYNGTVTLKNGTNDLKDGTVKLIHGTLELKDGAVELDDGANDLKDGAKELDDGAAELDDGAAELDDGAGELKDGMIKFDEEGIQEISNTLGEDVQDVVDRIDAIKNAGHEYKSFTKTAEGTDGSVKFIIKTDAIK